MTDRADAETAEPSPGMNLGDVYFILFRRKWIIILCSAIGVFGALAACVIRPPRYRSEAQLFIRYVVEGKSVKLPGTDGDLRPLNFQEAGILSTEAQILQSQDVARQVVQAVGAEKILGKPQTNGSGDEAALRVLRNLDVELPLKGSVINIFFQHSDPLIAQEVLRQIIAAYIVKHMEMHRPAGILDDLAQRTEQVRSRLTQTEQKLREAKAKAGVTSVEEAKRSYTQHIAQKREDIFTAQAQLAEHEAALREVTKLAPASTLSTNEERVVPMDQIKEYGNLSTRLDLLFRKKDDLATQFTEESAPVVGIRRQIAELEQQKMALEETYPNLASLAVLSRRQPGQPGRTSLDPITEAIQVSALRSKIEVLNSQLAQLRAEAMKVDDMEETIQDLQRQKDLQEADLKYYMDSMGQSRVEEVIGAGQAPNISIIQSPTPAGKQWSKSFKKKVQMLLAGGIGGGFVLAFLIELFLDQTLKRPIEVEKKLRLPLFLSIPHMGRNGRAPTRNAEVPDRPPPGLLPDHGGTSETIEQGHAGASALVPRGGDHQLRLYFGVLRDRLMAFLEAANLRHKPKLVAVTSCGKGAGVTTIAAGLAATLSEANEGNVLLVDMNHGQGSTHSFFRGKPVCGLDDALVEEKRESAMVQEHLYVAAEGLNAEAPPSPLPNRFNQLVPLLRASGYDFIIFDMPPVSDISVTSRLARFMDVNLLVVEAGKTDREVIKQASSMISGKLDKVGLVLNKRRTYVPRWLHHEL
jgi:polysaccharide biosynthesis transport protein